jgi:hypothetical protein
VAKWILILSALSLGSGAPPDDPYPRSLTEVRAMVQVLAARKGAGAQDVFLSRLRQYRFLCGVPYEGLSGDAGYADLTYHSSFICAKLNQMTHTPARPPGVTDEQYEKGRKGAGSSNLFSGLVEPAGCVDGWMDDSDERNIDRVGHRRWCLNPPMARSAFGSCGSQAAMYAFDASNKDVPAWDFVAYPARGYMPTSFFGPKHAWSVSPNMSRYATPVQAKIKVSIQPLSPGKLAPMGPALKLDYFKVDTGGFGSGPAIIFRPAAFTPSPDTLFQVEITGLVAAGAPATIKYVTHFVAPQRVSGPEATAAYTAYFKSRFAANQELSDKVDQLEGLVDLLDSEFAAHVEAAAVSPMRKRLSELLKDPAVKREHDAAQRYRQISAAEQKAGQSKTQLAQAAVAFRDLGAAFKDTRAGARAAADFERLKAQLDEK